MVLNALGQIAHDCWLLVPHHFAHVVLGEFMIMPNHMHATIDVQYSLQNDGQLQGFGKRLPGSLSTIVASYKFAATRDIRVRFHREGSVWQRNFHDHLIRNEWEYDRIQEYILNNPMNWEQDEWYV